MIYKFTWNKLDCSFERKDNTTIFTVYKMCNTWIHKVSFKTTDKRYSIGSYSRIELVNLNTYLPGDADYHKLANVPLTAFKKESDEFFNERIYYFKEFAKAYGWRSVPRKSHFPSWF